MDPTSIHGPISDFRLKGKSVDWPLHNVPLVWLASLFTSAICKESARELVLHWPNSNDHWALRTLRNDRQKLARWAFPSCNYSLYEHRERCLSRNTTQLIDLHDVHREPECSSGQALYHQLTKAGIRQ